MLLKCSKKFLISIITQQDKEIQTLKNSVRELHDRVQQLQGRLSKRSHNSHKPPSTDGYAKPSPKSQRIKSDRKPGGQPGHSGSTLQRVDTSQVDAVQYHSLSACTHCGEALEANADNYESRQECELPPLKVQVTEHRAVLHTCAHCGQTNRGIFPEHLTQAVQYGKQLKATVSYLSQYQLIPYARLRELFKDIFSVSLSKGTLFNTNAAYYKELALSVNKIKEIITHSKQAHFDEYGIRVSGNLHWLHVASTPALTYYILHPNRGDVAIQEIGILPHFTGCATHGHWTAYFRYEDRSHSLCNAHHLRELDYIHETYALAWCKSMKACLLQIKKCVKKRNREAN